MKTPYKTFSFETKKGVAVITIPDVSNSHLRSADFSYEFSELCADIEMDDSIRVVVVSFSGEKIAGKESTSKEFSLSTETEISPALPDLCESIDRADRPAIAVIHGDAVGYGLELAMACDIRIASESSHFGLPYIHHGLIPCDGGTQRLPRLVGKGKALEMILTGELIDAEEAYRIGLVNKITSSENISNEAMELARDMASKAPVSLRFVREAVYKGMNLTLDQGLRMEGDLYLLLYSTQDRIKGIESFRNKQKPLFEGK